jgi:Pentapeptide repeats (8 copies)
MANDEHVEMLRKGVAAWNAWRDENPNIRPDLSGAKTLIKANLRGANLSGADLSEADLSEADLSMGNLIAANLSAADLNGAVLSGANLGRADLIGADLAGANLNGANLSGAVLQAATLVNTDLTGADLTGCRIYGVSAWALKLERTKQQNLVITPRDEPEITVDNIEVAQFIYLMLHNQKIRDVIDTIGRKGVLLLGRFTEGRMVVLERLRERLRSLGFVPIVFNFDKPETKDFTETVRLLCGLSKFVIVDITNPRSAPLELQATVPDYMVPFASILQEGEKPFAMFVDLQNKYDWVLQPVIGYSSVDRLIEVLEDKIVRPAEAKFNELLARRTNQLRVENV